MIIDAHHHYMPVSVYREFADPDGPSKRVIVNNNDFTFNARLHRLDVHLRDMDEAGVDMALLSLSQWNTGGPDLCRRINEAVAEDICRYPGRLLAAGCLPQDDAAAAVKEIDYMIRVLGFHGVAMLTSMGPEINMSNKDLMWPIFQKISELDAPIFLHPHLKPHGVELDCTINRAVGRGFDENKAFLRIIYDVFPDFPDLKFVMPHFGGSTLALKGRMNMFFEPAEDLGVPVPQEIQPLPKTMLEIEEFGYKKAFDTLFDRFYWDGAGSSGWEPMTELAMMTVRHERLMWGCDYPFEIHQGRDMKNYLDSVRRMNISASDREGFFGGNLLRLLKMA